MLLIERVLGDRHDAAFAERLHQLEHHDALDFALVEPGDMARHRMRLTTQRGAEIAIALPRNETLFDGAVLVCEEDRAIVVRSTAQQWLRLSPRSAADALELGYNAGNLHWRVRFDDGDLLVALTGPPASYLARIAPMLDQGRVTIVTEGQ
jgi:urease accessory protein